ncbi:MAG: CBS domain-containing protein, partial [Pseudomonadota bacterium]
MNYEDYRPHSLGIDSTIRQSIQLIDKTMGQACLIVGEDRTLLGIVTDGDIRRFIMNGGDINQPVSDVMNKTPLAIYENTTREDVLKIVR